LFHADRRTDMTKLITAFRNFSNAPKKSSHFKEPESTLPCSKVSAICPYPLSDEVIPYTIILFIYVCAECYTDVQEGNIGQILNRRPAF
jgi:hypothetical protein